MVFQHYMTTQKSNGTFARNTTRRFPSSFTTKNSGMTWFIEKNLLKITKEWHHRHMFVKMKTTFSTNLWSILEQRIWMGYAHKSILVINWWEWNASFQDGSEKTHSSNWEFCHQSNCTTRKKKCLVTIKASVSAHITALHGQPYLNA